MKNIFTPTIDRASQGVGGYFPKTTSARLTTLGAVLLTLSACGSGGGNTGKTTSSSQANGSVAVQSLESEPSAFPNVEGNPCPATSPENFWMQRSFDGSKPDTGLSDDLCVYGLPENTVCAAKAPDLDPDVYDLPVDPETIVISDYRICTAEIPGDEPLADSDNAWLDDEVEK